MIFDNMTLNTLLNEPKRYARKYVPYNLVRVSNTEIAVELNVAGLNEDDLNVEVQANKLYVTYDPKQKDSRKYIVNHISYSPFTLEYTLDDDYKVRDANFKNGILTINFELVIPEEKRPKKIKITH
jgi:molecular chaperone IbpA